MWSQLVWIFWVKWSKTTSKLQTKQVCFSQENVLGTSFLVPNTGDHCQIGPRSAPANCLFLANTPNTNQVNTSQVVFQTQLHSYLVDWCYRERDIYQHVQYWTCTEVDVEETMEEVYRINCIQTEQRFYAKISWGSVMFLNRKRTLLKNFLQGFFLNTYCVWYPHVVPFSRNEMPFSLLKTPKINVI